MRLSNAPENFREEFDLPTLSGYLYIHNPKTPYFRMWCFRVTCKPCVAYCLPQLDDPQMRLQFPANDEWEVVCPCSTGFILEIKVGCMFWSRDTVHQDTVKDALNCLQRFYSAFNEHYPPITDHSRKRRLVEERTPYPTRFDFKPVESWPLQSDEK